MHRLFEEYQYQRKLIPWLLVALVWVLSLRQVLQNGLSQNNLFFDILILFVLPCSITLTLLLVKLSIIVTKDTLFYRMFPFHLKYRQIKLDQICDVIIKEYNTDRSFHGWGLRISWDGKYISYTINGHLGLELTLKNGKKIFIGSTRADELYVLLAHLQPKARQ